LRQGEGEQADGNEKEEGHGMCADLNLSRYHQPESRVLGNLHARFGEGREEKDWQRDHQKGFWQVNA
jgi:hypothetical protein